jgi:hypothetical protein
MNCFLKTAHEPHCLVFCSWLVRSISHGILGWVSKGAGIGLVVIDEELMMKIWPMALGNVRIVIYI